MANVAGVIIASPQARQGPVATLFEDVCDGWVSVDTLDDVFPLSSADPELLVVALENPTLRDLRTLRAGLRNHTATDVVLLVERLSEDVALRLLDEGRFTCIPLGSDPQVVRERIARASGRARLRSGIGQAAREADLWQRQVAELLDACGAGPGGGSIPVQDFVDLAGRHVMATVMNLRVLVQAMLSERQDVDACSLLNCPARGDLLGALGAAIDVLEQTKRSFKSKELAQLRHDLQEVLHRHRRTP